MKIEEKTLLRLLHVFEWIEHEHIKRLRKCVICKRYEHEGHKACDLDKQIEALKWSIAMEKPRSAELNFALHYGYVSMDYTTQTAIVGKVPHRIISGSGLRFLRSAADIIKELEQIGFEVRGE